MRAAVAHVVRQSDDRANPNPNPSPNPNPNPNQVRQSDDRAIGAAALTAAGTETCRTLALALTPDPHH